jgi:hypothetical protein
MQPARFKLHAEERTYNPVQSHRDLTLGAGEQKGTRGNYHSHLKANL